MLLFPEMNLPAIRRYTSHTEEWRGAVAEYYGVSLGAAKELLLRALCGYPKPTSTFPAAPHVLPFVEWLSMDSNAVRREACAANPEMLRYFEQRGRQKPESTFLFYALAQKEEEIFTRRQESGFLFNSGNILGCRAVAPSRAFSEMGPTGAAEIGEIPAR